jgi:Ca-activated chloride channel family protein
MSRSLAVSGWPFLLLALLVPLGWAWARRRRRPLAHSEAAWLTAIASPSRWLWWLWQPGWRSIVLLAIVLALLQPRRVLEKIETEEEGIAIMLVVDISSSMLAEDFRPENRIAVARREVVRFVDGRDSDWLGVVAFAGEALTLVPGTLDHAVVSTAVEDLRVGRLDDGTAIGVAVATAANRLRGLEAPSRVVVLLTDGDNNRGSITPEQAAAAAAALGIKVYTIGVGRDGVAPVPIGRTAFGYQYANMPVRVNEELLRSVASTTGGQYFRATDPEALTRIYRRIDELEKTPLKEIRTVERVALRRELLLLAAIALLAELLGAATRARRVLAP